MLSQDAACRAAPVMKANTEVFYYLSHALMITRPDAQLLSYPLLATVDGCRTDIGKCRTSHRATVRCVAPGIDLMPHNAGNCTITTSVLVDSTQVTSRENNRLTIRHTCPQSQNPPARENVSLPRCV
jgi:hypothetical protein